MALAAQADPLPVVDARRDLDLELALLGHAPGAGAVGTGRLDDLAEAPALRAGLRADDLAEERVRDRLQAARPAAAGAGRRRRAGSGAVPGRSQQSTTAGNGTLRVAPSAASTSSISTSARTSAPRAERRPGRPPRPPKRSSPKNAEKRSLRLPKSKSVGRKPPVRRALVPVAVVELARLGLREDLVGLGRLAEALLRLGVVGDVGVELARQPAERGLDRALVRVARDAEDLVVVARGGHGRRVLPASPAPAQLS